MWQSGKSTTLQWCFSIDPQAPPKIHLVQDPEAAGEYGILQIADYTIPLDVLMVPRAIVIHDSTMRNPLYLSKSDR